MQAGKQQEPHVMNRLRVYNSKDNLVWNDQVLLAIQRMGYNLDSVKQVPHPCMHTCRGRGRRGEGGGGGTVTQQSLWTVHLCPNHHTLGKS